MKLSKRGFGLAVGFCWGFAIFLITNFMLLSGGKGTQLRALRYLHFGYSFSFLGSIIGLIWGIVIGFIIGWIFVFIYNLSIKPNKNPS